MIIPNVEGLLVAALKADASLSNVFVGVELPATKTWPAVRITRTGGAPVASLPVTVVDAPEVQIDVWADRRQAAWDIMAAVLNVLDGLRGMQRLAGVSGCEVRRVSYDPDVTFDPPKPRYIISASLTTRAI